MSKKLQNKVQANTTQTFTPVLQKPRPLSDSPHLILQRRDHHEPTVQEPGLPGTPAFIDPRFGHDFSRVRIYNKGAVRNLPIQAKLRINEPGDVYEKEADRVAEQVMRMEEPGVQRQVKPEEEELIQTKPIADQITPLVQRQVEEEEEEKEEDEILQTEGRTGQTIEVTSDLDSRIQALKGGGQPLPESVRTLFDLHFGYNFNNVRIHTDDEAGALSRNLDAQAFTIGNNVFFNTGRYSPKTPAGKRLLIHELTHVVQQRQLSPHPGGAILSDKVVQRAGSSTTAETESKASKLPSKVEVAAEVKRTLMERYLASKSRELLEKQAQLSGEKPLTDEELEQEIEEISSLIGLPLKKEQIEEIARLTALREKIKEQVRLTALALMTHHRENILATRERTMKGGDEAESGAGSRTKLALQNLRNISSVILEHKEIKERLETYLSGARGLQTKLLQMGDRFEQSDLTDAFEQYEKHSQKFLEEETWSCIAESFNAITKKGLKEDYWRFLWGASRTLERMRIKQILAVEQALSHIYENYPVFGELKPEDVAAETDEELWFTVREAFADLANNVDEAIRAIATNDIHPFDLPKAVEVTRTNLPDPLKQVLDEEIRDRETIKFWVNFGLSAVEIVTMFIPVVGPALSLAVGTATLGVQLEDYLDRALLEKIAPGVDNPMGVSNTTFFEKLMLGVGLILTSFTVRSLFKGLPHTSALLEESATAGEMRGGLRAPRSNAEALGPPAALPEALEKGIVSQAPPVRVRGEMIKNVPFVRKGVTKQSFLGRTRFGKEWGAESIRAQEKALTKLEAAGLETPKIHKSFNESGELVMDYVGRSVEEQWSNMSAAARQAYSVYVREAKKAMGKRWLHDLKKRNIAYQELEVGGQVVHRFIAFDPALDKYTIAVALVGGSAGALIGSITVLEVLKRVEE